jgi:hypothetical protein
METQALSGGIGYRGHDVMHDAAACDDRGRNERGTRDND